MIKFQLKSYCPGVMHFDILNICSYNGRLYERLHHTLPALHHSDKELLETNSENDDKTLFIYLFYSNETSYFVHVPRNPEFLE